MKTALLFALACAWPMASSAELLRDCVVIPKAGGDCGGCDNLDCGQGPPFFQSLVQGTVKCGDVNIVVPAGLVIHEINVEWPGGGGWAAVRLGPTRLPQSDGSTIVSVSGKNWSGDLTRQMCLNVIASANKPTTPGRTR